MPRHATLTLFLALLIVPTAAAETLAAQPYSLPVTMYDQSVAAHAGKIYVLNGIECNGCSQSSTIRRLDPATGVVVTLGTTPTPNSGAPAVDVGAGALIFGGNTGPTDTNQVFRLDYATETVTTTTGTLPSPMHRMGAARVGGVVYLFGGYYRVSGVQTVSNKIVRYDIASGASTTLGTTLPIPLAEMAVAYDAATNTVFLAGGRTTGGTQQATLLAFDVATETATTLSATLPAPRFGAVGFVDAGAFYLFAGTTTSSEPVVLYDIASGTVATSPLSALAPSRLLPGSVVFPASSPTGVPTAYILGGRSASAIESDVWAFQPDAPATPTPEFGTLALTAFGLIALGAVFLARRP